jgi:hypothetical protein
VVVAAAVLPPSACEALEAQCPLELQER